MFSSPLSFDGRIRRTEYGITVIICSVVFGLTAAYFEKYVFTESDVGYLLLFTIPLIWVNLAQGSKRCHDIGKSGWWQLIPFFSLVLLFKSGNDSQNDYGGISKYGHEDLVTPPQNHYVVSRDKKIFSSPFSFEGRIRRTEFAISFMIFITIFTIASAVYQMYTDKYEKEGGEIIVFLLTIVPLTWFMAAQGAKRCHDLNNSGWWQLIPFYSLLLMFKNGDNLQNFYGISPKYPDGYTQNGFKSEGINQQDEKHNTVTTLKINSISYTFLQKVISKLREMKVVKNVTYEFDENQANITLTHDGDTQTLLEKLHINFETMEVVSINNGLIVVDKI